MNNEHHCADPRLYYESKDNVKEFVDLFTIPHSASSMKINRMNYLVVYNPKHCIKLCNNITQIMVFFAIPEFAESK